MKKALVIGAGIHGVSVALELVKKGLNVTIIDANSEILMGTSNGTHNRVNMGYHYPRSLKTAKECILGYEYFKRNLPFSIFYPKESFYLIEKNNSKVSGKEYKDFLKNCNLKFTEKEVGNNLVFNNNIQASFLVDEPCYDVFLLRKFYNRKLRDNNVNIILNFKINKIDKINNQIRLVSSLGHTIKSEFSTIINATYANTNKIQSLLEPNNNNIKKYKYQKTEVVVVKSKIEIPSLTVMDGPFITILPYSYSGHNNKYLVYDVENSILEDVKNKKFMPDKYFDKPSYTNYSKMKEKGSKYFKFMNQLSAVYSLYATRPIPVDSYKTDYRNTSVKKHEMYRSCYSIEEGKFVSAPFIAQEISEKVSKDIL